MRLALVLAGALALVATPAAAHVGRGPHRHVVVPVRPTVVPVAVIRPAVRPALRPVVVARPTVVVPVRPVVPLRRPALSVRLRF